MYVVNIKNTDKTCKYEVFTKLGLQKLKKNREFILK